MPTDTEAAPRRDRHHQKDEVVIFGSKIVLSRMDLKAAGLPFEHHVLKRLEAEGKFPRRMHLGGSRKLLCWDAAEVWAWLDEQRANRAPAPAPQPKKDPRIGHNKGPALVDDGGVS